jgi:hypothetical protein
MAGVQFPPLQAGDFLEQIITTILDRGEAEQSNPQFMRAIAA